MGRAARLIGIALAGIAVVFLVAAGVIYFKSEQMLGQRYRAAPERLVRPTAAAIADAPRQARLLGCLSCHGDGLRGNDVFDEPLIGDVIAPNLPLLIQQRSDQQIAAAIRQGISANGRPLLVMPSSLFSRLNDADVSALIAWIRTLRVDAPKIAPFKLTLLGRWMLLNGDLPRQPEIVPFYRRTQPADLGPLHAKGRYIAATVCAECHFADLRGGDRPHADFNTRIGEGTPTSPNLEIVGAYDLAAFTKLLRTGKPPDGRDLGMMSEVARDDFKHFTDDEIRALHDYLQARAQQ
ncbi:MAG: c-type cytochrome [Sphingomicrobium sp.]